MIEFAVGVDVTPELKQAVDDVPEDDRHELKQSVGEREVETGQQWAEVNFVPNWIGHKKSSPEGFRLFLGSKRQTLKTNGTV